ncbi:PREDICTED: uncharacterized protein LOC101312135 [Fragaria vesca subsp. vesca]
MLTSTSSPSSSLHYPILHSKTPTLKFQPNYLKLRPNPKPQLHLGASVLTSKRCPNIVAMSKSPKVEEQKFSAEGLVTESLPNEIADKLRRQHTCCVKYLTSTSTIKNKISSTLQFKMERSYKNQEVWILPRKLNLRRQCSDS